TWKGPDWLEHKRTGQYAHDATGFAQELLCDFGGADADRIMLEAWLQSARVPSPAAPTDADPVTMGLDVSTGGDKVCAVIRHGDRVLTSLSREGAGGEVIARWALELATEHGVERICYDAIGVGEGVGASLRLLAPKGLALLPVVVSQAARPQWWPGARQDATALFGNLRAQLWWTLRERIRRAGGDTLAKGPGIDLSAAPVSLITQLGWIRRERKAGSKIWIERKDKLRKRQGASPDEADALMLAYADDVIAPPKSDWRRPAPTRPRRPVPRQW
ncbi:MAG: hypothetical protein HRU13_02190, partial [Phycisphaerales bacterium]|nr:hypothetical protein [Phycisphaerales bacterium]